MPSAAHRLIVACAVATVAFWAYSQTLVPGIEPGDSGGFQAALFWPEVSARQAYPLYYATARPIVGAISAANPARGLNLVSAIWGALAVGLLGALAATLSRSLLAGAVAGLLLAFSYTFWSQAIIAEVYTLHLLLVGLCLFALHRYGQRPGEPRLAMFFAIYALAFGNHLSMILLGPAFALFIVWQTPDRRSLLRPRTVAMALGIAAVAALQYWPSLMALWTAPGAPAGRLDRLASFWFDVTMADWRAAMVLGVDSSQLGDHLAMWWFDARQQFGLAGIALAAAGAVVLTRRAPAWGTTLLVAWSTVTAFALTYNVGDAHVFFLPGHFLAAIFAGAAVATPARRPTAIVLAVAVIGFAGWRGWDTWPAIDRHADRRAEQLVTRLTAGLSGANATLVTQLDWQVENVLLYQTRFVRQDLSWRRLPEVLLRWPFIVEETHQRGRDVVLTADAARDVVAAYGGAFPIVDDPFLPSITLAEAVARIPRGAPYVLSVLPPPRGTMLDAQTVTDAVGTLTGGRSPDLVPAPYRVIAGLAGEPPAYSRAEARPFRESFRVLDEPFTVRMDSWVAIDTFRRAGFGHVLRGREHVLIIERGISLVWFGPDGAAAEPVYVAGLYASRPRFRIPADAPRLAQAEP